MARGDAQEMDHRSKVAEKKRLMMRTKLIDAATRVFADSAGLHPVIDDVIREARVSRGTFYNYFDSLEQVLAAIGQEFSNQMITDILPVYDILSEPWQRASVGFRVFLVRALLDRKWAGFMALPDAWPHHTLLASYMAADLENGKRAGQFRFDDVDATVDFLMGATARAIQSIRQGLEDANAYMNAYTRMALASLGCERKLCDEGVRFSLAYLQDWASGRLSAVKPIWALNLNSKEGQLFLGYTAR
ncbi:MAG TPA: helix-turn-helix domain-containing protein [Paraburkholderia sp.]|jgi:AcrR family transcriptional regulator|uniref:TetR/AcrR family transcriptional regulator n=1 Tax=Paraburkholderia sp. TaxID=1926495 RepID=UPI002DF2F14C|nr:helix-turn-helix domain-containing protein [Paraburkholderia sp.]